ncbi:MAG: tyrosine-type recombinase/integrase [Defluviitaleaceae bacterium]|nr:tyrosine-type recombinase/integrase [Defluviitaleaceae bacterium]
MRYHEKTAQENEIKLRSLLKELPPFMRDYFRSLSDQTTPLTRLGYAMDFKVFLGYLSEEHFDAKPISSITIADLGSLTVTDIEAFMEYLTYYIPPDAQDTPITNASQGKSRKLAAVRVLFRYLYRKEKITANPAELVGFPKINSKTITTLEPNEIAKLIDEVESGENLTPKQQHYHQQTKQRDIAIIIAMLGTGMRISECVGLDLDHIDFDLNGIKVTRKGGDEMILYFGSEVEAALKSYLEIRQEAEPQAGHENALFLSLQNRRITTRAIQNLVKKYASLVTRIKNISPHKLRSTFGTQLYAETSDIYLVANVLGHVDVNTTRKHYAKMDDNHRRRAANAVKLRSE